MPKPRAGKAKVKVIYLVKDGSVLEKNQEDSYEKEKNYQVRKNDDKIKKSS